jgi:hypothetical protein
MRQADGEASQHAPHPLSGLADLPEILVAGVLKASGELDVRFEFRQ